MTAEELRQLIKTKLVELHGYCLDNAKERELVAGQLSDAIFAHLCGYTGTSPESDSADRN